MKKKVVTTAIYGGQEVQVVDTWTIRNQKLARILLPDGKMLIVKQKNIKVTANG